MRDVLESLTRSYLALGEGALAQATCARLVKVGHLQNVLLLRVELARSLGDTSSDQLGAWLCHLLDIHSGSDRLWLYLADWYRARRCPSREFSCLERAESTERSVNTAARLQQLKEDCQLEEEIKRQISSRLASDSKRRAPGETASAEGSEDFVDLGSSIQRREKEENLDSVTLSSEDDANTIKHFEARWLI